jgi:hypothetical protein
MEKLKANPWVSECDDIKDASPLSSYLNLRYISEQQLLKIATDLVTMYVSLDGLVHGNINDQTVEIKNGSPVLCWHRRKKGTLNQDIEQIAELCGKVAKKIKSPFLQPPDSTMESLLMFQQVALQIYKIV